jgi:hypothetical protein
MGPQLLQLLRNGEIHILVSQMSRMWIVGCMVVAAFGLGCRHQRIAVDAHTL